MNLELSTLDNAAASAKPTDPGVIAPSHIPMINLTAKRPPKLWHAAWQVRATPQMKILMLCHGVVSQWRRRQNYVREANVREVDSPHPFSNRELLESEVLRVLECEVAQVEDSPQPSGG